MAKKKVKVCEYTVRAHVRVIRSRVYMFICKQCNKDTERESYGPRPLYCERCRPPASKTNAAYKKKKPRPVRVQTAKAYSEQQNRAASG
jgi:hypothetical protein